MSLYTGVRTSASSSSSSRSSSKTTNNNLTLSTLIPFLRHKLCLTTSLTLLLCLFFLTYLLGIGSIFSSSNSRKNHSNKLHFPSDGLRVALWKELDLIQIRSVILEPVEIIWKKPSSQDTKVPWLEESLFPKPDASEVISGGSRFRKDVDVKKVAAVVTPEGGAAGAVGASDPLSSSNSLEPVPRHRIEVFPRKVLVPGGASSSDAMMFGTVTTVARAKLLCKLWTRWLVPQVTEINAPRPSCLIVVSAEEDLVETQELRDLMEKLGLKCAVKVSHLRRYEERVLSMIKEMQHYAKELDRTYDWFVFGDDDTFWLDIKTLQRMLSKYDPALDWFIGATTEAQNQLDSFGKMAFGGAGMIVSSTVMVKMYGVWDTCFEKYHHIFGGDEMITRCAARATGVTKETVTTEEKGLHQFDIPGDTTGVLQSGIEFLNLHHYIGGSWVHLFGYGSYRDDHAQILLLKQCLDFLGGDNLFKRYVFGNGKWLLTQGYSITVYEEALKEKDLLKAEHTWYEGYRLNMEDRASIPERHDSTGVKVKQTFYIDGIKVISPNFAIFTYVMADKWDEHLTSEERERLEVLWDGNWAGGNGNGGGAGEIGSKEGGI